MAYVGNLQNATRRFEQVPAGRILGGHRLEHKSLHDSEALAKLAPIYILESPSDAETPPPGASFFETATGFKKDEVRRLFVRKVYTILSVQLAATAMSIVYFKSSEAAKQWVFGSSFVMAAAKWVVFVDFDHLTNIKV